MGDVSFYVNASTRYDDVSAYYYPSGGWHSVYQIYYTPDGTTWHPIYDYAWQTGAWGACSVECGGGTQTRAVTCIRGANNFAVDDYPCLTLVGAKPATSQECNTHPCIVPKWCVGTWSACSAACGGGTQTRTVVCKDQNGNTIADSFCVDDANAAIVEGC